MNNESNPDREMRLGILNAFQTYMHRVSRIAADCQHDTTTAMLNCAERDAWEELTTVLLAHPANQPKANA